MNIARQYPFCSTVETC